MKIAGSDGSYQLRKIRGRDGVVREYWYRYWYDSITKKMQCKREDPPSFSIPKDMSQELGGLSEEEHALIKDFRASKRAVETSKGGGTVYTQSGVRVANEDQNVFFSKAQVEQEYGKLYLECTDVDIMKLEWLHMARNAQDTKLWERELAGDWSGIGFPYARKIKNILGEWGTVFELGYENLTQDEYFQQLKAWDIAILVDVRERPVSTIFGKGHQGFNKSELKERCAKEEWSGGDPIRYVHFKELGNLIRKDPQWKERWKNGYRYYEYEWKLREVLKLLKRWDICLLCKEEDVSDCHRQFIKQDLGSD